MLSKKACDDVLAVLRETVDEGASPENVYAEACRALRSTFPHYNWVGIYMLEGETLVLRAWDGPQATEHVRIPVGQGVCGLAARTGKTVNVPDVTDDPRYLSCFLNTRSELVVPIARNGTVIGEVDIDSDAPRAFTKEDERFVEAVAMLLSTRQ